MSINTKQTFLDLVAKYHKNPDNFVFFVGAGLSIPLFPSWSELLKKFVSSAEEIGLPYDSEELISYIEKGEKYLDIADICISIIGEARYRDIMEEIFDINISSDDIPESYNSLMELYPKTIITTNYDRLPEIAGRGLYRIGTNKNPSEILRSLSNKKNVVFKLHGDIMDQSSIVLTSSDYDTIINSNSGTQNLISSILSTKTLIFIGFSLSDPHLDIILRKIKTINSNIPISHYALVSENSKFKISSFENNYGLKIISYIPDNKNHPEVIEFLRALNNRTQAFSKIKDMEKKEINDKDKIVEYINESLSKILVDSVYSVFVENEYLHISISSIGETNSEIQKEILSLIRLIDFKTNIIKSISVHVILETHPNQNTDENQKFVLSCSLDHASAKSYADRGISTTSLWKKIKFEIPSSVTNIFTRSQTITFPLNRGIIEEYDYK